MTNWRHTVKKKQAKNTVDHMNKRQHKLLKALTGIYNLFTETLTFPSSILRDLGIKSPSFSVCDMLAKSIAIYLGNFLPAVRVEENHLSGIGKKLARCKELKTSIVSKSQKERPSFL